MNAVLRQRNPNRIADPIGQQRADADRAFDAGVFAFAGLGHAEMNRIVPIRAFLAQARDQQPIGIDHHFRIARFHREYDRVVIKLARDPRELERALHHAERAVAVAIHDAIGKGTVIGADSHSDSALFAKLDERRETVANAG